MKVVYYQNPVVHDDFAIIGDIDKTPLLVPRTSFNSTPSYATIHGLEYINYAGIHYQESVSSDLRMQFYGMHSLANGKKISSAADIEEFDLQNKASHRRENVKDDVLKVCESIVFRDGKIFSRVDPPCLCVGNNGEIYSRSSSSGYSSSNIFSLVELEAAVKLSSLITEGEVDSVNWLTIHIPDQVFQPEMSVSDLLSKIYWSYKSDILLIHPDSVDDFCLIRDYCNRSLDCPDTDDFNKVCCAAYYLINRGDVLDEKRRNFFLHSINLDMSRNPDRYRALHDFDDVLDGISFH